MLNVPLKIIRTGTLLQHASRTSYRGSALHFGNTGTNRYDDPSGGYGVLYLGFELSTVLMESVFHGHEWSKTRNRCITKAEVGQRMVRAVGVLRPLHLADLTAPDVMASCFGVNLVQLASRNYAHTQGISAHLYGGRNPKGKRIYDGILYPSRNNYPGVCIALFDCAASKVAVIDDIDLRTHVGWPDFLSRYEVTVLPR